MAEEQLPQQQLEKQYTSLAELLVIPVVVLAINGIALAVIAYFFTALVACKVLFIELAFGLSLFCIAIVLFNRIIQNELIHLEVLAVQGQDEATAALRQGRYALHQIQAKMDETLHPHEDDTLHELFSNVVPMVQLFVNKEKNLLRWGMFGWKLVNNAMRLMNQRNKNT